MMASIDTKNIYIDILNRELSRLQSELPQVKYMATQSKLMSDRFTERELMLTAQIDQVKQEIEKAKNDEFSMIPEKENQVTKIDSKLSEVIDESQQLTEEISTLNEEAANTTDSLEKSRLLAEARAKTIRLEDLRSKRIKFGNRQRSILLKKSKKESLKREMIARQEAKVVKSEMKAKELDRKQMDNDDDKFLNALVVDKVLEVRRRASEWKASFDRQVLENLKNSRFVGIKGARAIAIAKTAGQRLRDRVSPVLSTMLDFKGPEDTNEKGTARKK